MRAIEEWRAWWREHGRTNKKRWTRKQNQATPDAN
jgi:hypothetical protein